MAAQPEHPVGHLEPGYHLIHHIPFCPPYYSPTNSPAHIPTHSQDIKAGLRHYGQDSLICGFWWSFAQAVSLQKQGGQAPGAGGQTPSTGGQSPAVKAPGGKTPVDQPACGKTQEELDQLVKSFENLCLSALGDFRMFASDELIQQASFQAIEDNEELRAHNGFTGFRKILLVSWAHGVLRKQYGGNDKVVTHDAIANYLSSTLRFHDDKQKPTVNVVRDLMQLVKQVGLGIRWG